MRYLSQRYTMSYKEYAALLTDTGTEETNTLEEYFITNIPALIPPSRYP